MYASEKGHKEVVEILLSAGADVSLQNKVCGIVINHIFSFVFYVMVFVLTFMFWFCFLKKKK